MKYFYSHLIKTETLLSRLDELKLSREQKLYLAKQLDEIIHHEIMDAVLLKLTEEDKRILWTKMVAGSSNDILLEFLNEKVDNIEKEITVIFAALEDELGQDITEALVLANERM